MSLEQSTPRDRFTMNRPRQQTTLSETLSPRHEQIVAQTPLLCRDSGFLEPRRRRKALRSVYHTGASRRRSSPGHPSVRLSSPGHLSVLSSAGHPPQSRIKNQQARTTKGPSFEIKVRRKPQVFHDPTSAELVTSLLSVIIPGSTIHILRLRTCFHAV